MNDTYKIICKLVSTSMFGVVNAFDEKIDWQDVFNEMKAHGIASIVADMLHELPMDSELKEEWKDCIFRQRVYWERVATTQDEVCNDLDDIPYAIIKGMNSAIYYPRPELRSSGDIDILIGPENFNFAVERMRQRGYQPVDETYYKHYKYKKNGIDIEIHKGYAFKLTVEGKFRVEDRILSDIENANLKKVGIHSWNSLPDFSTGLVLLYHMFSHIIGGIGLRQIIDWMMFLNESGNLNWDEFNKITKAEGIYKLQCAVTRICHMYLGLQYQDIIYWMNDAEDDLCEKLFSFIVEGGNFGFRYTFDSNIGYRISFNNSIIRALTRLQKGGMCRWKLAQKYKILSPFAWIYQSVRIVMNMAKLKNPSRTLKKSFKEASSINDVFSQLGLKKDDPRVKADKYVLEKLANREYSI